MLSGSGEEWEIVEKECRLINDDINQEKAIIYSVCFVVWFFFTAIGFLEFAVVISLSLHLYLTD